MSLSYVHSLLILSISLFTFFHHQPIPFVNGDTDLIENTCKNTKYYDLCVSSLKSDPTSPNADIKGLAVIMVGIGMSNATATSSYLSSQILSSTSTRTSAALTKKVLKLCAEKYSYANDSLRASIQDLVTESYDYAYIHVMAASDYPNACHNAFKRSPGGLVYPTKLALRENGFKKICDVVLGIFDLLGW